MPGDVIQKFDGASVDGDATFGRLASGTAVDRDVSVVVLRDGRPIELSIRPRKREPNAMPITRQTQRLDWAGVTFANDGDSIRVAAIVAGVETPFVIGTRIARVNGRAVADVATLLSVLHGGAGKPLDIDVSPAQN